MTLAVPSLGSLNLAAEAARLAQAQLVGQPALPPHTTITASYSFAIGEDGQLTPTGAQVVTHTASKTSVDADGDDAANAARSKALALLRQSQASLRDITNPKAQLAPADEAEIFTSEQDNDTRNGNTRSEAQYTYTPPEGSGETPVTPLTISEKQQQRIANLYALNADAVYHAEPIVFASGVTLRFFNTPFLALKH